jgi:hydroxymethylpyrimidine pyrophosphatase-like HAD family hydrolase
MKIIFLDIDGVLNNYGTRKDNDIDPKNIEVLNNIVKNTGAKIVVSSTWRRHHTIESLSKILIEAGLIGEVISFTPSLRSDGILRGNEIYEWMNKNEDVIGCRRSDFNEYVILDDDSDMLYWQRENFICVNGEFGLTNKDAYKAEWILNSHCNTKE